MVRLELVRRDDGGTLQAEVSRQHYTDLGIVKGDEVHVSASRMKVFVQDGADRS
jgi:hypothetical protein